MAGFTSDKSAYFAGDGELCCDGSWWMMQKIGFSTTDRKTTKLGRINHGS
jgi:hypothetical protein